MKDKEFEEEILENFLKTYYSKEIIPNEIIIQNLLTNKEDLENFFLKEKNMKTKIIVPKKSEKLKLLNLAIKNLENDISFNLEESIKQKLDLKFTPNVIECYDISNLAHTDLVGAMTRWKNEVKDKQNFRKFNIKSFSKKNDDYHSFCEVFFRRYLSNSKINKFTIGKILIKYNLKNLNPTKSNFIPLPNLIMCDGGVGQLNSAKKILEEMDLLDKVDLISLAKKEEIIYKYKNGKIKEYNLNNNSREMIYIRNIRDSVHNFVKNFNISKRKLKK